MKADSVLAAAWPGGVPEEERAYLASLAPERGAEALRRVDALVRSERDDPSINLAEIARGADLSRATFYQLRKRWSAERSLRSITPYEERKPRDIGTGPEHDRVRAAAEGLMNDFPDASDTLIVQMLKSNTKLGKSTLSRLVGDARRGTRLEEIDLRALYGRTLLVGLAGVRLRLVKPRWREEPTLAACAFVVDQASGLVLGNRLGEWSEAGTLTLRAGWRALLTLQEGSLDRPREVIETVVRMLSPGAGELTPADPPSVSSAESEGVALTRGFAARLKGLLIDVEELPNVQAQGNEALGAWLDDQGFRESRQSSGSILIAKAVEHHNQPILQRLELAELVGSNGVPAGAMSTALLTSLG